MFNSKKVANQITEIKDWCTKGIPEIIAKNPSVKEYFQQGRLCLNLLLIETMIGAEISVDTGKNAKGDYKVKFNRCLPTVAEMAEISNIMADFVKNVEGPFLSKFAAPSGNDDDMAIPPNDASTIRLERVNAKSLKDLIFNGGNDAMTNRMLNAVDCIQLAGIGCELRKKTIRNRVLIAGGIALVVTGGIIVGMNVYKAHKEKCDGDDADAPVVDLDSGDMPELDMTDSADAPVVEID